jgi:hypothetical protein
MVTTSIAHAQLLLLIPLLILFAWAWLFFASSLARGASDLHPVVLLPRFDCSQLDVRPTDEFEPASAVLSCGGALKGKKPHRLFRLWNNHTALLEGAGEHDQVGVRQFVGGMIRTLGWMGK